MFETLKSITIKNINLLTIIGLLIIGILFSYTVQTTNRSAKSLTNNQEISPQTITSKKAENEIPASLKEAVTKAQYKAEKVDNKLIASNSANNMKAEFDETGLSLSSTSKTANWQSNWRLKTMGFGDKQTEIKSGELISKDQRVEIKREESNLIEWFENRPNGLEHGYTLAKRPANSNSTESLRLVMEVTGNLKAVANQNGQSLTLKNNKGKEVLQYKKLKVWDADNKEQLAKMHVSNNKVFLEVEETNAKYPLTIDPTFVETKKVTASDGAATDNFGFSVSISGETAVVGAFKDDDNGSNSGSAYILEKNEGGADNWGEVAKLTASDGATDDGFGYSASISGDTVIVSAVSDDDNGTNSGSAYIFERNEGGINNWGQVMKLTPIDGVGGDNFGYSASISGDTVIVGAYLDDGGRGSAYIFERNQGGANNWGEVSKLIALDGVGGDQFGFSASISGDTAVVSAWLDDNGNGTNAGSGYIFERNEGGANNWGEVTKLTTSDGTFDDRLGYSVSISSDRIVIGAYRDNPFGSESGSAYIFDRNQGGANNWGEFTKLTASDGAAGDQFGFGVSVLGDTVLIGSRRDDNKGSSYIYQKNEGGANNWGEVSKLIASDGATNDNFGLSVALSSNTAIVSSFTNDEVGTDAGAVYIFPSNPTLTVTKTADTNDGTCDSDCSLREAIAAANAVSTDDTINFATPLFDTSQTITLVGSQLALANNGKTIIDGPGADLLTISGNNLSRVFYNNSGTQVEINAVTISGGFTSVDSSSNYGAGLYNAGGTVTLNHTTVSGNTSTPTGGGLANEGGTLTLNNSTVSGNTSTNGGGGGIYSNAGSLTLNNTTVSGNSAQFSGGGIFIDSGAAGTITLSNSTITNNSGSNSGGMVTFRTSNISNIGNTIIADNNAPTNPDVSGSFNSFGYNLIGKTDGSSGFGASGDLIGTVATPLDPVLGPLQDNGGSTFTHLLLGGSPAINTGNNALLPIGTITDQRGVGFPRIVNSIVDIGAVEVTTLDQTITFGALASMTYGDVPFVVSASSDSGLAVSFAASGNCSVSGNMVTITGAGSCNITASQAGNGTYNAAPNVDQSFTTSKATLTVSPNNQTITFGDSDPSFAFGYSSFVSPDNSGDINTEPTCGVSGVHSDAGTYTITCSGGTDDNYNFSYNTATLTVNKADQTITFGALADKSYGDSTFSGSASASSGSTVSFSAAGNCTILGTTITITATGSCTITASQSGDSNYNAATDVDQTFNISKAMLSVTPDSQTITFGDADPTFTFSYSGFIVPDGSTVIDTDPACNVAGVHTDAGDYPITCSGGTDNNYSFNFGAATLTIEKTDQTISFAALADKTFGDAPFVVSATATSSLTVSFAESGDCSIVGSTVTITGAGSCNITASQVGDGNYNVASDVAQSFTISKVDQTINFGALADKTFGDAPFNVSATSTSGLAVSFAVSGDCTIVGSTVTITGAGNCTITASQVGDDDYNGASDENQSFTINQANQTITFAALANKTYGDGTFSVSATASSGLTVGFTASGNCSVLGTTVTITGAGNCIITASQTGNGNYNTATDVNQNFTINKAVLNVTPNDQQKLVGSPDPTFTFSYSGFVNSENSGVVDTAPTCEVTVVHSGVGSYTITCSSGVDNNYSFSYGTATLNVIYNFNGFFNPIDNLDLNNVKAGRGIPVKFSLNGDFGLNILAAGYPVSYQIPCNGSGDDGPEIPTETAGNSSLSYSSENNQYKYVWKTEKSWKDTCRTLVVGLNDGTFHTANFKFK